MEVLISMSRQITNFNTLVDYKLIFHWYTLTQLFMLTLAKSLLSINQMKEEIK